MDSMTSKLIFSGTALVTIIFLLYHLPVVLYFGNHRKQGQLFLVGKSKIVLTAMLTFCNMDQTGKVHLHSIKSRNFQIGFTIMRLTYCHLHIVLVNYVKNGAAQVVLRNQMIQTSTQI